MLSREVALKKILEEPSCINNNIIIGYDIIVTCVLPKYWWSQPPTAPPLTTSLKLSKIDLTPP